MTVDPLLALGLRLGDTVRYQRTAGGRWHLGTVTGLEKDGSIAVHDAKGGARSLPLDRLEVRTSGKRGTTTWESAAERASRCEQLPLL